MYVAVMPAALLRKKGVSIFHALSDGTRLMLLDQLKEGERCVCELTDAMKAGQSRLSFHLRVLKEARLILDRREGRWMYYSLNPDTIEELGELVTTLKHAAKSATSRNRRC